jgi:hypothetical protein
MTPPTLMSRTLAAVAVLALALGATAGRADAQPRPARPQPNAKPNPIIVHPQINTLPGIPAWQINPPAFNPGPLFNPALNNPWLNQTQLVPVNPFANPFAPNPLAQAAFLNNPFAVNAFASPYATSTPPMAIQQPGQLLYRGPDLQVNPTSGLVYRPLSGVARTADGSVFYRVPNSGLPTAAGAYAPGSGLYYDPRHNSFLNPSSGVISRPGTTTVFVPWLP